MTLAEWKAGQNYTGSRKGKISLGKEKALGKIMRALGKPLDSTGKICSIRLVTVIFLNPNVSCNK